MISMGRFLMILFTWCTVNFVFITWLLTRVIKHQQEQYEYFHILMEATKAFGRSKIKTHNSLAEITQILEEIKKLHQPIIKSVPVKQPLKKKQNDKN